MREPVGEACPAFPRDLLSQDSVSSACRCVFVADSSPEVRVSSWSKYLPRLGPSREML